jgi:excisionase family DNA binding protein
MAAYTLGTASQATGCAKSTILRAIKAGRIPAVRDDFGRWQIEPAQLFHVFPTLANPDATPHTGPMEWDTTTDTLVAELRAVIADLRREQDDLRQERDHWRAAHEREQAAHAATQRLLLPDPQRLRNGTHRRRARAHRLPKRR